MRRVLSYLGIVIEELRERLELHWPALIEHLSASV
jgi:hypothetical protein